MLAIIMVVAGLVIAALSWAAAAQQSDVGGVPANKKPDGDTKPSNDLALSRDRGLERGTVDRRSHRSDQVDPTPTYRARTRSHSIPRPTRYPSYVGTRRKGTRKKAESYLSILDRLFKTNEHSRRGTARTPEPELDKSRERSRERSLDRSRGR